jgi:hypothetical protein
MEIELVVFKGVEDVFDSDILFKGKVGFTVSSIRIGFFEEEENGLHVFEVLCWTWSIFLERGLNVVCGVYVV